MIQAKPVKFIEVTPDVLFRAAKLVDDFGYINAFHQGTGFKYRATFRREMPEDIAFLRKHFGGYYYERSNDGQAQFWLNLHQHRAYVFIFTIAPFLKRKRKLAEAIVTFREMIPQGRMRRKRLSDEEKDRRKKALDEIKAMNKEFYDADQGYSNE